MEYSFENISNNLFENSPLGSKNSSVAQSSYNPFQSFNFENDNSQNIQDDSNKELINIQNKYKDMENNNKYMLYLKMNNLIQNYNLLENERDVIQEKKNFKIKLNEIMDNIKCKSCAQAPKVFYICRKTKELICQDCLEKESDQNKHYKFCPLCKDIIFSKEHFVELPIINKILSYIDTIKDNNNKLFDDTLKKNMDKSIIFCNEKIHEHNQFNQNVKEFQMKAVYFCMECQRPFCSDCILSYKLKENEKNIVEDNKNEINDINDDNNQSQHNQSHHIFKIDLIKEFGLFDLLYEKCIAKEIMSDLDKMDKNINDKIKDLNLNKQRMLLFIDYVKNIYMQRIDEIIDKLKSINDEKSKKVKIILENSKKLSKFLNIFKSKNDFKKIDNKNSMKELINLFESFHTIPNDIYKKANSFIKVKGTFNVKALNSFSFNFILKSYIEQNIPLNKEECLRILYENKAKTKNNKSLDINGEEEKKVNEEDKIKIKIKKREKSDNNQKIKEFYNCRILVNNNNNELIEMKDSFKKKKMKKNKFNEDDFLQNNIARFISFDTDLNDEEMYEKQYLAEFNINSLKKVDDLLYNINFEIYDFYIY